MNETQVLFDTYKTAVYEKDVERFVAIFDADVQVFDMWGKWSYEGLAAWREMVQGWFGSLGTDRDVVNFDDVRTVVSGDMAFISALGTFVAVNAEGKRLRALQNRLTWVVQKKEGGWKIIHEHTSSPLDPATAKAIFER